MRENSGLGAAQEGQAFVDRCRQNRAAMCAWTR